MELFAGGRGCGFDLSINMDNNTGRTQYNVVTDMRPLLAGGTALDIFLTETYFDSTETVCRYNLPFRFCCSTG